MDIMLSIDKLDELVQTARSVPMTDMAIMDRQKVYAILDEMRSTIPDEIKQARWLMKEKQQMIEEAQVEADRIIKEAESSAEKMAANTEIVKISESKAEEIMNEARDKEREVRMGAEDYADEVLANLEVNLGKILSAVERNRERLHGTEVTKSEL